MQKMIILYNGDNFCNGCCYVNDDNGNENELEREKFKREK